MIVPPERKDQSMQVEKVAHSHPNKVIKSQKKHHRIIIEMAIKTQDIVKTRSFIALGAHVWYLCLPNH